MMIMIITRSSINILKKGNNGYYKAASVDKQGKIFREMNVFEIRYMNRHVVHVLTCHHHPIDLRKFKRLDATAPFFFFLIKTVYVFSQI